MAKTSKTFDDLPINQSLSLIKRAEKRESTRSLIALTFMIGWLVIIGGLIVFTAFDKLTAEEAKDYLLAIGSPLGFITAYYFKTHDKE